MITVFFVCQPGRLELQARILAASLRHFSKTPLKLRASIPNGFPPLSRNTVDFFGKYAVEMAVFEPVTARAFDYPYGNKIDAACERFEDGRAIFMDTDIIAQKEFDLGQTSQAKIFAVPVHQQKVFGPQNLDRFNQFAKSFDPKAQLTTLRAASGEEVVAAFNSGFVNFEANSDAPHAWRRMLRDIMASELIRPREKKPYGDQLALAMLYALDSANFAVGKFKWNASVNRRAIFCHYHRLIALFRHDYTLQTLHVLDEEARSRGASLLGEVGLKDFGVKVSKTGECEVPPLLKNPNRNSQSEAASAADD